MSELKQTIISDMTAAMKARDKVTTGTLRMLKAALQTEETSGAKHELDDQQVLAVIAREIKRRRESADVYAENGRPELAEAELAEVAVLEKYQPKQLDDAELTALLDDVVSTVEADSGQPASMASMGPVMKAAKEKAAGRVDGKRLSEAVRARLQG